MRLPSTLTSRLVLTTVGAVALVCLVVSLALTVVMRDYLYDQLDDSVERSSGRAQGPMGDLPFGPESRDRFALIGCVEPRPGQGEGTLTACFGVGESVGNAVDRDGDPIRLDDEVLDVIERADLDGRGVRSIDLPGLGTYRVAVDEIDRDVGTITIVTGLPTGDVEETLRSLVIAEIVLSLAGIGLAFAIGSLLVRRTLTPLREVAAAAHEVTELDLQSGSVGQTVRVPERLTDEATEVGQVGASLNRLLGHVEEALDSRHRSEERLRQFVADASHELRTPLTTIRGYAELAGRRPELQPTSIAKVSEEAHRMTALVEDLLLLARLDSGRPLERREVDLTRLLVGAVDDARVVDDQHTWMLDLPDEPVRVVGDELRLHQVVTNLLTNARRHTPEGTVVTAGLRRTPEGVLLTVHDTGPGVPADIDVFDRFARGDSSRTRASGGAGLGLSLVRAIVTAHGGAVSVDSRAGDTTFRVELPIRS